MITLPVKVERTIISISFGGLTCAAVAVVVLALSCQVSGYVAGAVLVVWLLSVVLFVARGVKRWLASQIRTECERARLIHYLDAIKTTDDLPQNFRPLDR